MPNKTDLIHKIGIMLASIILIPFSVMAQGSIFGSVQNSSGGTPAQSTMSFYGFIDNSDHEIRIESCIGAGYEVGSTGNWFDDFQNYLSEAPGMPYQYHFYNADDNQGHILSKSIPDNSFQQEPVVLESVSWPVTPQNIVSEVNLDSRLVLHWDSTYGQSYHIYRRESTSGGSFFRIDDPGTVYTDGGVNDSTYVDTTGQFGSTYSYVIIPANGSLMGPHSDIYTFTISQFLCGDVNNDDYVNVLDILELIDYKFREGSEPDNLSAGDADGDGYVNVLDILALIDYKFREGPAPTCGR